MGKRLICASMAYLRLGSLLINAGRTGSFQDRLVSAFCVHILRAVNSEHQWARAGLRTVRDDNQLYDLLVFLYDCHFWDTDRRDSFWNHNSAHGNRRVSKHQYRWGDSNRAYVCFNGYRPSGAGNDANKHGDDHSASDNDDDNVSLAYSSVYWNVHAASHNTDHHSHHSIRISDDNCLGNNINEQYDHGRRHDLNFNDDNYKQQFVI